MTRDDMATDNATLDAALAELATLDDPKMREINERHGDDHGVNLSRLRDIAKRVKPQPELAAALWATDSTAAMLLSLLISRPTLFSAEQLDAMMRQARAPKVQDWLINYIVKRGPHAESLRLRWKDDPAPAVAAASWALTSERVAKQPAGLDVDELLGTIESEMKDAPGRVQWNMNMTLAMIGIHDATRRNRAIDIGERLEVFKDYPTPPNCTSPFAPAWISELVSRQGR